MAACLQTDAPFLCLTGRPSVHHRGESQALTLKYRKGYALLGFLAAHEDKVFRRETLADLLWPDIESSAGRANLRVVLADLSAAFKRLGLPEVLEVQRDWLALRASGRLLTDVKMLSEPDTLAPSDWHEPLRQATTTWLEDAEDGTSDEFREWLTAQRHHHQQALERLLAPGASAQADAPPRLADRAPPAEAPPQVTSVTLLRVEFADSPAADNTHHQLPSAGRLELLRSEAAFFDGLLLDFDDAGCTFAFGLDSQHTGQRWQALRCAANLHGLLADEHGLRMGVTSGKALLTRAADGRPSVLGWRRRLVDRLALCADDGELVCDESLLDLVPHFGCTPLGERRFRGINRDFQLFSRRLAETPPMLLPPGGDFAGSFFGREAFLAQPMAEFEAVRPGQPRLLCLHGEAGLGKTRVAREFAQRIQAMGSPTVWVGALPEAQDIPWRGLNDFFSKLLVGAGSPAAQLERALAQLHATLSDDEHQAITGFLSLRNVPQSALPQLASGVSALLRGRGQGKALVVIDDVQWLDAPSADLFTRVIQQRDPVLWLMTRRAKARNPIPAKGLRELALPPLDDRTAEAILDSLPDADMLSATARRGRIANARGLPLYLLAESVSSEQASHFSEFCQALLNRLGAARAALEAAAVLGMLFSVDDLAQLCGPAAARQACDEGLASGLLVARGAHQTAFFHPRLREYLLSVTAPELLQQHARHAAQLLGERRRLAEAAVLWEQAQQPEQAREAWFAAASQAIAEDDISAACNCCTRLAELGYFEGAHGIRARMLHAHCLIARDGYGSAQAHQIVTAIGDSGMAMPEFDQHTAFNALALAYLGSSSQGHMEGLNHAQRMEQSAITPAQKYTAYWAMGNTLFWLGRFGEARLWFESNLALGETLALRERMTYFPSDPAVFARAELAWLLWLTGDSAGSQQMIGEAMAYAENSVTRQDLCIANCFKGFVAWCAGDYLLLAIHAEQALLVAESEGFTFWRSVASLLVTLAQAHAGQAIDFAPLLQEAGVVLEGYRAATTTALWFACGALEASQQHEAALQLVTQTLDASTDIEHRYCRMDLWRIKGVVLAARGAHGPAREAFEEARRIGQETGAQGWLQRWQALLGAL